MTPCEHLIYVLEPESKNLMVEYDGWSLCAICFRTSI